MGDDDLSDRVGVDQSDVENKWDEMVVEDNGLLVEIERHENPCREERKKPFERWYRVLTIFFADFDDIQYTIPCKFSISPHHQEHGGDLPLSGIEDQDSSSIYHVPLVKG